MSLFQPTKKNLNLSTYVPEEDIVHYVRVQKLVKAAVDEKGNVDPDDFLVEEVVVEDERVNRADYINSFREDVGIANILKKVALSGDVSLLNQVQRPKLVPDENGFEPIQDATILQSGEENIAKIGEDMRYTYASIPEELTKGRSLEKFHFDQPHQDVHFYIRDTGKVDESGCSYYSIAVAFFCIKR